MVLVIGEESLARFELSRLSLPGWLSVNCAVLLCQINDAVVADNIHRRSRSGSEFPGAPGCSA
jgi:hypothetical protein